MAPLSPERWRLVEPILDKALELEPGARSTFLARACAGDPRLRAEVEALLAADQRAGDFLAAPLGSALASLVRRSGDLKEEPEAPVGRRIGPYRLLRELGRGGMGVVYLAERADGQFEQQVAIKLIRWGVAGDDVRQRFFRERQILARLQHPAIARLLDGGVTTDGQPYFAMEQVDGEPITRYCDALRLTIEDRLELFARVCQAVEHAHDHGVVHRDLKPANILVTPTGELKLLDFGIAKPLSHETAGESITLLLGAWQAMTPEYASPEQVRAGSITAATDVYALGVMLYELLSGHRPYRFERPTPQEVERVVCEQEPRPPSVTATRTEVIRHADRIIEAISPQSVGLARRLRPDRLRRRLAGDLDAIVLRAMAKDPDRRYASVRSLQEDLARYLEGQPVVARRPTLTYRLRSLTRRHRPAWAIPALAALAAGAAGGLLLDTPTGTPRGPPPSATDASPSPATVSVVADRLYQEGLRAYYQQELHSARRLFRAALAEDSSFALASYYVLTTEWALALAPDTALEAHLRRLAGHLPDRERLVAQGRIAWSSSDPALLPLAETLTARFPDEPEGQLLLGRALAESGHIPRALPRLREVVRTDSLGLRSESPHCYACEAMVAMIEGYIALDSLDAAADLAREWVALQPGSGQPWLHLALVLERQGETDGALAAIGRAAPLVPGNRYLPIYPAILSLRAGEFEAADRLLREHARAGAPDVRMEALWFLTISLRYQGRLREAIATTDRMRRLRPDMREPAMAEAQVLFEMGRAREAAGLFDSIAALPGRGEIGRSPSAMARWRSWHLTHSADARAAAGDTVGLDLLADTIRALGAQTLARQRQRLHHHVRGLLLVARGRTAEAVEEFYRATLWPLAPGSGFTRTNLELGRALVAVGRPREAIHVLHAALRRGLEAGSYYVTLTELHEALGKAYEAAGRGDSALVHYRWVVRAWADADTGFHDRRARLLLHLAAIDADPPAPPAPPAPWAAAVGATPGSQQKSGGRSGEGGRSGPY